MGQVISVGAGEAVRGRASQLRAHAHRGAERLLTRYPALAAAFALPVSFVFDHLVALRNAYVWKHAAPEQHDLRVRQIQDQVRRWAASGRERPMCTARAPWMTMSTRVATYKQDCSKISIDLHDVLGVDETRRIVRVEPLVTMGQISRHLLPLGWAPAVMIEMDDLTFGGVCMGLGMATSSHRFGLIQETVEAYELILADGSLVRATRSERADLFHALPWSHGTIGLLVSVELRIVPVKPYVRMQYTALHCRAAYCAALEDAATRADTPDFLEATIFSRDEAVLMSGWFAEQPAGDRVNAIGRWHKPWFYKHVETKLRGGETVEYLPLRDYYHRHTRSMFWELQRLVPFGNHPLYRWLLGWLGAPKVSLLKLAFSTKARVALALHHVVQDFIVPISNMAEALDRFDHAFGIYPILAYPIRVYDHGADQLQRRPAHPLPGRDYEMFVDLGAYGVPPAVDRGEPWAAADAVRGVEAYAREVGGYQCLYADTFMTRTEFEQMFDHRRYRELRKKYGAVGAFPEVYDKVRFQLPAQVQGQ